MPETNSVNTSNISENHLFKQLVEANKNIAALIKQLDEKDRTISSLTAQVADLNTQVAELTSLLKEQNQQILALAENGKLMAAQKYGRKSEKRSSNDKKDDSDDSGSASGGISTKVNTSRPIKPKKKRKARESFEEMMQRLGIVPETVLIDLNPDQKICPVCGSEMSRIGESHVRYELEFEMPKIRVIEYVRPTYCCDECRRRSLTSSELLEKTGMSPVKPEMPASLLPGSWASSSLLSFAITLKVLHQIPTNRLITMMKEMGCMMVTCGTLSTWLISVSRIYFEPLYSRLKELLTASSWIQADETTLRVINESYSRRKIRSFLWQYRTAEDCEYPIVMFDYCQGRSGKYAAEFLDGFNGVLLVDGYSGYNKVEGATLAHCWVHARRYFIEASMCTVSKTVKGKAAEVLNYIDRLFDIECEIKEKNLDLQNRLAYRQKHSMPVVEDLFKLVKNIDLKAIGSEKLRKAYKYLLNHEAGLKVFLNDPVVPAHNNSAEEAFVSIARGRNNWLFAYSEEGARAIAVLSSIVKTAKRCGLNVFKYIQHVLNRLKPLRGNQFPAEVIESVLPWSDEIMKSCKLAV